MLVTNGKGQMKIVLAIVILEMQNGIMVPPKSSVHPKQKEVNMQIRQRYVSSLNRPNAAVMIGKIPGGGGADIRG